MKKALILPALAAILAGSAYAQTARGAQPKPASVGFLSAVQTGKPVRMDYQIKASAWVLFVPISGKANFQVDLNAKTYTIQSAVKTTGLADILVNYDMRLAASGFVTPKALNTFSYVSQNNDGKKNRRVDLKYHADRFEMTAKPAFGNLGDPAATTPQVLDAKDPITALISFGLEPRAPGSDPCGGPMKIFDGRQLTHLHFKNQGLTKVKSEAWSGKAYECHVTMDKVAGYKKGEVNKDTLTGISGPLRMWLAPLPNGATIPVRIEAKTDKIGTVVLQAAKLNFTPL